MSVYTEENLKSISKKNSIYFIKMIYMIGGGWYPLRLGD